MTSSKAMLALGMMSIRPLEHPVTGTLLLQEKVQKQLDNTTVELYLQTMELIYTLEDKKSIYGKGKEKKNKKDNSKKWTSSKV